MRIVQVATFVSADGAFGGPVAVAAAQAQGLAARGHDVEFLAGWDGAAEFEIPGVEVSLFRASRLVPGAGFSGLVARGLTSHLRRRLDRTDVVHLHLARDLITLPAARSVAVRRARYVVQPHGMIIPDSRLRARVFDGLAVRRVLADASFVLAYPGVDEQALREVSRNRARLAYMVNGVAASEAPAAPMHAREATILFMARLHPRKGVLGFAAMARLLRDRGVPVSCAVVGPDEGDLPDLLRFIDDNNLQTHVRYEGAIPYAEVRERLSRALVYVLPSVQEPFPVAVLEAMAVGTPSIVTDSCGLAPYVRRYSAGAVTDGSPSAMADAVQALVANPSIWLQAAEGGQAAIAEELGSPAVAQALEELYLDLVDPTPASSR